MLRSLIRFLLLLVGITLTLEQIGSVTVGQFTVTPTKALTALLLVLAGLEWIFSSNRLPRNRKTVWILAFYISLVLSTVYSFMNGTSGTALVSAWTRYLSIFFFYFLLTYIIRSRKELDLFLFALVLSGLVASLSTVIVPPEGGYWQPERASGVGGRANQTAASILMVLPLAVVLFVEMRSVVAKLFLLGSAGLLLFGFMTTLSRSAFLGLVAIVGLWFLRFSRPRDIRYALPVVFLLGGAAAMAPDTYFERIQTLTQLADRDRNYSVDLLDRMTIYKAGFSAFASNPLLGVGPLRFGFWASRRDPRIAEDDSVHNAVLKVASEQGLLGVVPYVAILLLTWLDLSRSQNLVRRWRGPPDDELRALYVRAAFVQLGYLGVMIVAQFQPGTFWKGIWAMIALSTVIEQLTRRRIELLGQDELSANAVDTGADVQSAAARTGRVAQST